jgi:single-strand DNA-binding protein
MAKIQGKFRNRDISRQMLKFRDQMSRTGCSSYGEVIMTQAKLFPNDIKRTTIPTKTQPQPKSGINPGMGTATPLPQAQHPAAVAQIDYRQRPMTAVRPSPSLERASEPISVMGRIGRYFDVKSTAKGTPLAVFSVASSQPCLDEAGTWTKKTVWHKIVVWGDKALAIGDQLQKGVRVYVEGKFKTREWLDRNNNPHVTTELVAREVRFLDDQFAEAA